MENSYKSNYSGGIMSIRKQYSASLLIIIGIALLLIIAAGGIVFGVFFFKSKPSEDFENIEVAEEPVKQPPQPAKEYPKTFPTEKVCSVIADELSIPYPPKTAYKTHEVIAKQVRKAFHKKTKRNFTNKAYTKLQQKIIFKYMPARKGQKVEFYMKNPTKSFATRNLLIKGKFRRKEGYYIYVDSDVYSLFDIDKDYHYLFDKGVADKVSHEKLTEAKQEFKTKKEQAFAKYRPTLEEKYYKKAGYLQDEEENWLNGEEYVKKTAEKAQRVYNYLTSQ